jgi:hypothetical protein
LASGRFQTVLDMALFFVDDIELSFSNYLANFCADYMAHSRVWASFPQFRKRREIASQRFEMLRPHLEGKGHSALWLLKPRFPTEQP